MTVLAMNLYEMGCYLANMCNQDLNILLKQCFTVSRVHANKVDTAADLTVRTFINTKFTIHFFSLSRVHNSVML